METSPESPTPAIPAPSTEELAELESEFARLEAELTALEDAGDDTVDPPRAAAPPDAIEGAST